MLKGILGVKKEQSQGFDALGHRVPITVIQAGPCPIVQIKTKEKDGYEAIKYAWGGEKTSPLFLREIKGTGENTKKVGDKVYVHEVFGEGDKVNVTGISKGKGFAGVVKRHHFKGGPKTHGQSDRLRAPGSIGSSTTPGRVYKGKRMAGRLGGEKTTIKNLKVLKVDSKNNFLTLKGLVPGGRNSLLVIQKG